MKFKEYIKEGNQAKDFINKFKMKMKGSTLETAVGWIDGIGEIGPEEKVQILKGINKVLDKKEVDNKIKNKLKKDYKWFKDNF